MTALHSQSLCLKELLFSSRETNPEVPSAISKEAEVEIKHATGIEKEELIGDAEVQCIHTLHRSYL